MISERTSDFSLGICLQGAESSPHQGIDFRNMDKIKMLEFLPVNLGPSGVFILCETKLVFVWIFSSVYSWLLLKNFSWALLWCSEDTFQSWVIPKHKKWMWGGQLTRAIVAHLVSLLHCGRNVGDYTGSAKPAFKTSPRVLKLLGKAK